MKNIHFDLVFLILLTGCGNDKFSVASNSGNLGGLGGMGGNQEPALGGETSHDEPEMESSGGSNSTGGSESTGGVESASGGSEVIGPCDKCPNWISFSESNPPAPGSCVSWPDESGRMLAHTFIGSTFDNLCSPSSDSSSYCQEIYGNSYQPCE